MAEEVGRRLAGLLRKRLAQKLNLVHAVDAKEAEIVAQLAPRSGGPERRVKEETQGTHLAAGLGAFLVAVAEANFPAAANRRAQTSEIEGHWHPPQVFRRPQRSIVQHPM